MNHFQMVFMWTFVHFAGDLVINIKCWLTIDGSAKGGHFGYEKLDFQGAVWDSLPGSSLLSPRQREYRGIELPEISKETP